MKHYKETLDYLRTKGGKVEAVHRWATGWQVLVFDSRERFETAKQSLESKPVNPQPLTE